MNDLIWSSEAQMRRIEPYFFIVAWGTKGDDWRVVSEIVFVIRNGLRWRDAPQDYGPHERIHNCFIRRASSTASLQPGG